VSSTISPLRYPGGKQKLAGYFRHLIRQNKLNDANFYELYAGGASISLELLSTGFIRSATLLERDPLIYCFWKSAISYSDELVCKIRNVKITLATWKRMRKFRDIESIEKERIVDMGFAGLFLNRTNFSGILNANPIGGMTQTSEYKVGCRFNKKELIKKIMVVAKFKKHINVEFGDALEFLKKNKWKFRFGKNLLYLDPPYFKQGPNLYRFFYTFEDHKAIAETMSGIDTPWIVSYDRNPTIEKMYRNQVKQIVPLNYEMKHTKKVDELIISNLSLSEQFQFVASVSRQEKLAFV
jgi:DNA adenine methylase